MELEAAAKPVGAHAPAAAALGPVAERAREAACVLTEAAQGLAGECASMAALAPEARQLELTQERASMAALARAVVCASMAVLAPEPERMEERELMAALVSRDGLASMAERASMAAHEWTAAPEWMGEFVTAVIEMGAMETGAVVITGIMTTITMVLASISVRAGATGQAMATTVVTAGMDVMADTALPITMTTTATAMAVSITTRVTPPSNSRGDRRT